jgi:hypothetical protein
MQQYVILIVVVLLVAVAAYCFLGKKGEESFRFRRQEVANPEMQGVPMRPDMSNASRLAPRFDVNRANALGENVMGAEQIPMPFQAAPPSPIPTSLDAAMFEAPDFSQMGGAAAPIPTGAITSDQAQDMLKQRIGGGKPEYQETSELMPTPDMTYSTGIDPTNPETFMYDRTIFGKLKRRYGNDVDYIRGDLDITPEYRGWFDLQPPSDNDVVKGYFEKYIDVQQATALQDSQFTRSTPVEQLFQNKVNPWGDMQRYAYENV